MIFKKYSVDIYTSLKHIYRIIRVVVVVVVVVVGNIKYVIYTERSEERFLLNRLCACYAFIPIVI